MRVSVMVLCLGFRVPTAQGYKAELWGSCRVI